MPGWTPCKLASVPVLLALAGTAWVRAGTPAPPALFLARDGGRLAYDDTGGTGPLVIAVPGVGDLRQEYRYLTPVLHAAGYRVATLDLRGFGASSARWHDYTQRAVGADMVALEWRLGRRSAVLIGACYAAGAAIWAAHDPPERVQALVLMGPVLRDHSQAPAWYQRAVMALAFAGPWRVGLWLRYWDSLFITRTPPDQAAYRHALAADLRQPGRMRALDIMLHTSKVGTTAIVGQVRIPTLIVMGSKDPDQDDPAAEAAWIAGQTGGRVCMLDGAGHYPQTEMAAEAGPMVVEFLHRLAAATHDPDFTRRAAPLGPAPHP